MNAAIGRPMIAALFVMPDGPYAGLSDVEIWDEVRDARTYDGPHPVVAHPPCAAWSRLAGLRAYVHGLKPGEDDGCFDSALRAVRTWGGVLEHPAHSSAWQEFGLTHPMRGAWRQGLWDRGWVTEVSQSAYGHRATKHTWLYFCGGHAPPLIDWRDPPGLIPVMGNRCARTERPRFELSRRERKATPIMFRDLLLDLARSTLEDR